MPNLDWHTSLPDFSPTSDPTPLVTAVPGPDAPQPLPAAHNREGGTSDTCSEYSIEGGFFNEDKMSFSGGRESTLGVTLGSCAVRK